MRRQAAIGPLLSVWTGRKRPRADHLCIAQRTLYVEAQPPPKTVGWSDGLAAAGRVVAHIQNLFLVISVNSSE